MNKYIGTKTVHAEPEARRGQPGYKVRYEDGYESWSPADAFEKAYRPTNNLNFGHALEMLKAGYAVVRAGWNGKGMFVYLVPEASYPAQTGVAKLFWGKDALVPYRAYLALKDATGRVATWVPSITDLLADDWSVSFEEN